MGFICSDFHLSENSPDFRSRVVFVVIGIVLAIGPQELDLGSKPIDAILVATRGEQTQGIFVMRNRLIDFASALQNHRKVKLCFHVVRLCLKSRSVMCNRFVGHSQAG